MAAKLLARAQAALLILASVLGLHSSAQARDPWAFVPRAWFTANSGSYPLDSISREPPIAGRCPEVPLSRYAGTTIRFERPARIYEGLVPKIRRLEELVRDTGIEVYGRAPRRILHAGAYNCRAVRGFSNLLSEHGLGNALDVRGFTFGALPRRAEAPEDMPRGLRRGFTSTVERHWASDGTALRDVHARFWRRLRERLEAEPDLFRGMLGPSYPGHHNHLHFDMAPWSLHHF